MKTKSKRPRFTVEECVNALTKEEPRLADHVAVDRDWVWLTTKVRKTEYGNDIGKRLYALGFRPSHKGHAIPGTTETGWWGNSCQKPTPFFKGRRNTNKGVTGSNEDAEPIAADDLAILENL